MSGLLWISNAALAVDAVSGDVISDGGVESQPYEYMATVFAGNAVQRLTEQGMALFGGMGVISGMPIEKYVRDALIQKHISFQVPLKFRITETLTGYKRKVNPLLIGGN